MTQNREDLDLHARFAELRDELGEVVPTFAVRGVGSRRRVWKKTWLLAPLGSAAVVALLLWGSVLLNGGSSTHGLDMNAIAWSGPTDFLLDTPGRNLLRTVPLPDVESSASAATVTGRGAADSAS